MFLEHGGDTVGYELTFGYPPVDFSASLNPMGMPKSIRLAAARAIERSEAYPDPLCRRLTQALAEKLGLPGEMILPGSGAADILFRLVLAKRPRKALIPVPTFVEYQRSLKMCGCRVHYHYLKEQSGFAVDESLLDDITPDTDMLFLCQPNNPTGQVIPPKLLSAVLDKCISTSTLLVLDECFTCFLEDADIYSLMGRVMEHPGLFILGSFTKLYAMAGIRLGYGISADLQLLNRMRESGQPWEVSTVAQAAGIAALQEKEYVQRSLEMIHREKSGFIQGLASQGFEIIGSQANFIFFHMDIPDLRERLAPQGVLIRDCSNFTGLSPGYYRAAVRTKEENNLLLEALEQILSKQGV